MTHLYRSGALNSLQFPISQQQRCNRVW